MDKEIRKIICQTVAEFMGVENLANYSAGLANDHLDKAETAILKLFKQEIDNIILDDKFAITCQTLKQYRELIRAELHKKEGE
jgi:hypothetical protein